MKRLLWIALFAVVFAPSVARAQSDEVVYYHTDAIGSVRMITNASGVEIARYDYTPFGTQYPLPGPSDPTPDVRQFAGKEHDDTGLDYFGARYYNNYVGRFTTVDPVLDTKRALYEPQLWNRYAYVTNNPLRFVDPNGRQREYLDQDIRALLAKQITIDEYNARIQARGIGAAIGVAPYALPALGAAINGFATNALVRFEIWRMTAVAGGGALSARALERLAQSGGPTVRVITNQTQSLQPGRAISAAAGEGAQALANAARSGEGVRTFVADIPKALIEGLVNSNLAVRSITASPSGAVATEYRFLPGAAEYVIKFFQEVRF